MKPFRHTAESWEAHQETQRAEAFERLVKLRDEAFDRHKEHLAQMNRRRVEMGRDELPLSEFRYHDFHFHSAQPQRGMGHYRSYLCPKGLITPEDVPENWGLIWYDPSAKRSHFTVKREPKRFDDREVNIHGGMTYLMVIMQRMVLNIKNWQEFAQWGRSGHCVSGSGDRYE
ncbi:hypothetical protein [Rhizobium ruizarguesonis]|uniref:hypothetical protein n=1 Tax=Rhizobium ruizarguesonis TaxID=2081791 RepID=UPI0013C28863|nr:hypothetical protein [Rhizobium ruizarguesonis]NEH32643.1 hypothetical protein [Rhizobium ruizarguesonis]NEK07463.1 hypothetical protein [Rhizobium ruizarguesonis]